MSKEVIKTFKDTIIANVMKDVHVAVDGKSYVTMNGLARLSGVSQQAVTRYFNNLADNQKDVFLLDSTGCLTTKNEKYILDTYAIEYLEKQMFDGKQKAAMTLAVFAKVGLDTQPNKP